MTNIFKFIAYLIGTHLHSPSDKHSRKSPEILNKEEENYSDK